MKSYTRPNQVKNIGLEVHHYAIFSVICLPNLLGSNILLNTVLKNPQSVFLPQSERPSFAPIQHNWLTFE